MSEPITSWNEERCELSPVACGPLRDEPEEKPEGHPEAVWLGNRWWIPNDTWRSLRGILADSKLNMSEERARERTWELEHDARKFGFVSKP